MVLAKDNLIKNVIRRKFYCCPFLPSPRPNQAVFLYRKAQGRIVKRLWVLPSDMVMAELASIAIVDKRYKTMQAWSVAFFEGKFWEYIRYEHQITMLSQLASQLGDKAPGIFDPERGENIEKATVLYNKLKKAYENESVTK